MKTQGRQGHARGTGPPIARAAGVLVAAWIISRLRRRRRRLPVAHGIDKPLSVSLKVCQGPFVRLSLKVSPTFATDRDCRSGRTVQQRLELVEGDYLKRAPGTSQENAKPNANTHCQEDQQPTIRRAAKTQSKRSVRAAASLSNSSSPASPVQAGSAASTSSALSATHEAPHAALATALDSAKSGSSSSSTSSAGLAPASASGPCPEATQPLQKRVTISDPAREPTSTDPATNSSTADGTHSHPSSSSTGAAKMKKTVADVLRNSIKLKEDNKRLQKQLQQQRAKLTAALPAALSPSPLDGDDATVAVALAAPAEQQQDAAKSFASTFAKSSNSSDAVSGMEGAGSPQQQQEQEAAKDGSSTWSRRSNSRAISLDDGPSGPDQDLAPAKDSSSSTCKDDSTSSTSNGAVEVAASADVLKQIKEQMEMMMEEARRQNSSVMGALMENQARLAAMEVENNALKEELASLKGGNSTPTNGSELGNFKDHLNYLPAAGRVAHSTFDDAGSTRSMGSVARSIVSTYGTAATGRAKYGLSRSHSAGSANPNRSSLLRWMMGSRPPSAAGPPSLNGTTPKLRTGGVGGPGSDVGYDENASYPPTPGSSVAGAAPTRWAPQQHGALKSLEEEEGGLPGLLDDAWGAGAARSKNLQGGRAETHH